MPKLGFLGPKGSFCELAAEKIAVSETGYVPYSELRELIKAVNELEINKAIVPIENSLEGAVNLVLDLLVEFELKIVSEVVIPVEHNLIANQNVALDEIKHVISHPQALAQCRGYLLENLSEYQTHRSESTAKAVKSLKKQEGDWAAIGTSKAAKKYQLKVLRRGIQDNQDNWTRFVVLGQEDSILTGEDKTSIVCSPQEDHPGALYEILKEFAEREINLTKIESRPAKKMLGEYIFFIDLEGHRKDLTVKQALNAVEKKTAWFKLLGSYPQAVIPE